MTIRWHKAGRVPFTGRKRRDTVGGRELQNLGLEHLDIIVPDTEASARFRFEDNNRIVVELRVAG